MIFSDYLNDFSLLERHLIQLIFSSNQLFFVPYVEVILDYWSYQFVMLWQNSVYAESKGLNIPSQAREYANELRASNKTARSLTEGSTGSGQNANSVDTSSVADAYAKLLTVFIPLMVDEVKVLETCLSSIT